eukprot:TRINITY_DN145_c0_g1_i1.p1 TRINITY_DN145_c0_g1~~TRINITY_DN145_c0_g1_i1.p1  ORF type:complete len:266 (-),score=78.07 TRINITY_DN145_c0_g1_i1:183-980(-)
MEKRIIAEIQASEARIMAALGGAAPAPVAARVAAPAPAPVAENKTEVAQSPAPPARPAPAPAPAPAKAPPTMSMAQSPEGIDSIDIGDKGGWVEDTKAQGGMAGIMVESSCAKVYNDVRRTRNGLRWGMFQFDKSCSWIIPTAQCKATDDFGGDWANFVSYLPEKSSAYAVYNFDYNEINGRYSDGDSTNVKSRFCLFAWSPKGSGVKMKMLSATSVKAIKEVCKGTVEASIHDKEECDWDSICQVLRINAQPLNRATHGAYDGY